MFAEHLLCTPPPPLFSQPQGLHFIKKKIWTFSTPDISLWKIGDMQGCVFSPTAAVSPQESHSYQEINIKRE